MCRLRELTAHLSILFVILTINRAHSQFPAKKFCADVSCSLPIAEAETLTNYRGGGGHDRVTFRKGATVKIFGVTGSGKKRLFDIEVNGQRGWVSPIHIKELRKLANASVEVLIPDTEIPAPSPSPPVPDAGAEISGGASTSVDPLEELLRKPVDPSLLDSFLNPSPTTTGPDFATASVSHTDESHYEPSSTLGNNLEPTPSLQLAPGVQSTVVTDSSFEGSSPSTSKIELQGDKFWSPDDEFDEGSGENISDDSGNDDDKGNQIAKPTPVEDESAEVVVTDVSAENDASGGHASADETDASGEEQDGPRNVLELNDSPQENDEASAPDSGMQDVAIQDEKIPLPSPSLVGAPAEASDEARRSPLFSADVADLSEKTEVEQRAESLPDEAGEEQAVPSPPVVASLPEDTHKDQAASPPLEVASLPEDTHKDQASSPPLEVASLPEETHKGQASSPPSEVASLPEETHKDQASSPPLEAESMPEKTLTDPATSSLPEAESLNPEAPEQQGPPAPLEVASLPENLRKDEPTPSLHEAGSVSEIAHDEPTTPSLLQVGVSLSDVARAEQGTPSTPEAESFAKDAREEQAKPPSPEQAESFLTDAQQEQAKPSSPEVESLAEAADEKPSLPEPKSIFENAGEEEATPAIRAVAVEATERITTTTLSPPEEADDSHIHQVTPAPEELTEAGLTEEIVEPAQENTSLPAPKEESLKEPPPTVSPHFYYASRSPLEVKADPVDEVSYRSDENVFSESSLETAPDDTGPIVDHPFDSQPGSEEPLPEPGRDYASEIPFDSGEPDDGPKVSGAFEDIADAFHQLFDNFLDAVLPIIQYVNTALQPLWPHIHAVVPPKYLNQVTMLTIIVALYTVLTSFLYFVVRFVFRNKKVERELIITANQVSNLVSLRDALKEENLNLTVELEKEQHMHIQAGSRISKLEVDLDLTKKNLREVEKRLKAELEEKDALQRELVETTETLESTQSVLNESLLVKQGKFSEDDDALQMQFETLEKMLNDQTSKVTSLRADLNFTKEENAKLKEQYLEAERNMVDKEEELAKLYEDHESLLKRSQDRDESLETLKLALGLENEGPESGENPIVSSFRSILSGDGDVSSEMSNLFDVGRAKRQIRELEMENEQLQVKVTEREVLRENAVTKDAELERLREKEKELQFVETFYRKKEEELLCEISRLKQREDRFLSQEKEGKTMADYVQTMEEKLRFLESDKQNSDVRGKEKVIELEKELCDCKFRLQQTQRRLEGVITENNELRKRAGLRHSSAKASPSGSIGDGVDGLMQFAPDLVPPMLPPGMLPPPHLRGPGGHMLPPPMMGPRPPMPPGMPGGPPPPLTDRLPPLGDQGRPEPPAGRPGLPPFQLPPRPPYFPGPPGMMPPPPHLMGRPGSPTRASDGGNGGGRSRNRSPSPGWSDRSAPARGFYRSSMRRRSRSISPNSRGPLRSPPYRPNMGPMDFPDDRSIGSNGGRDREGGRGSVPPSQPRRLDPRGGRGGRYSESPSPPPPPYYDDPPSRGSRGRRDDEERRRNGRSPNAYV